MVTESAIRVIEIARCLFSKQKQRDRNGRRYLVLPTLNIFKRFYAQLRSFPRSVRAPKPLAQQTKPRHWDCTHFLVVFVHITVQKCHPRKLGFISYNYGYQRIYQNTHPSNSASSFTAFLVLCCLEACPQTGCCLLRCRFGPCALCRWRVFFCLSKRQWVYVSICIYIYSNIYIRSYIIYYIILYYIIYM
jgi:hypothetical protein